MHRGCYVDERERETKTILPGIISLQNDKGDGARVEILAPRYVRCACKSYTPREKSWNFGALRYCDDNIWHFSTQESNMGVETTSLWLFQQKGIFIGKNPFFY